MPLTFNQLLREAGLPLEKVRLIRHADKRATSGRSPYDFWRKSHDQFDAYQRYQMPERRGTLNAPYWAVFVSTPTKKTMFVGIYSVKYRGLSVTDTPRNQISENAFAEAGTRDVYDLKLEDTLREKIGELFIDWGHPIQWAQRAQGHDKPITKPPAKSEGQRNIQSDLTEDLKDIIGESSDHVTNQTALNEDIRNVIEDPKIAATEKVAQILARIGQGDFRKRVLELWGNCCSVTGSKTQEAIRASHIKPWRDCDPSNGERLDVNNGLPLVANLDALFDNGLISFESSGEMIVSSKLSNSERQIFSIGGRSLSKKPSEETAVYLAYHRENYFQK